MTGLAVTFVLYSLTYAYIYVGGDSHKQPCANNWLVHCYPIGSPETSHPLFLLVLATSGCRLLVDRFTTVLMADVNQLLSTGSLLQSVTPEVLLDMGERRNPVLALCMGSIAGVLSFGFTAMCPVWSITTISSQAGGPGYFVGSLLALVYLLCN